MRHVMTTRMNGAMSLQREPFLGAGHDERDPARRGYTNGYKPKRVDTPAGPLHWDGLKTARAPEPFHPQSLERGRRACRAVMCAAAAIYVKGVSTCAVETIVAAFGMEGLSSTQGSRAAKRRDDDRDAWRQRPLGRLPRCA
jgi:putative transposase